MSFIKKKKGDSFSSTMIMGINLSQASGVIDV
jgi:hypothetical protein